MAVCLVDTSAWVHALRPDGDPEVAARVRGTLVLGQAPWCSLVRLQLWNGARGAHEQGVLRELCQVLPDLAIDRQVWQAAYEPAREARACGVQAPGAPLERNSTPTHLLRMQ